MDTSGFLALSTTVCRDLRSWVEEARRQALLSEGQLLTLSDAADVIDRATTALAGRAPDPSSSEGTLEQRAADAADEAGSALLPRDRVLTEPKSR